MTNVDTFALLILKTSQKLSEIKKDSKSGQSLLYLKTEADNSTPQISPDGKQRD